MCKSGSGWKYSATFRGERKKALSSERIRAHANSLPSPEEFDYSSSGIIWDEIDVQLKPMVAVDVTLADFDQTWAELETKAPEEHEALKPLRLALRPLLTGVVKQPYHGGDDASIRALLPAHPDNLNQIINELETILKPDLSFFLNQPDSVSSSGLDISKGTQHLVNRQFRRLAHEEFSQGFQKLALNWLVPLLNVWAGERGAFRCERQELIIFIHSDRHASVARAAECKLLRSLHSAGKPLRGFTFAAFVQSTPATTAHLVVDPDTVSYSESFSKSPLTLHDSTMTAQIPTLLSTTDSRQSSVPQSPTETLREDWEQKLLNAAFRGIRENPANADAQIQTASIQGGKYMAIHHQPSQTLYIVDQANERGTLYQAQKGQAAQLKNFTSIEKQQFLSSSRELSSPTVEPQQRNQMEQ